MLPFAVILDELKADLATCYLRDDLPIPTSPGFWVIGKAARSRTPSSAGPE
jgi:hypothetical protein